MRRFIVVPLLLSLLFAIATSLSAQTRPRRVGGGTSEPQQQPSTSTQQTPASQQSQPSSDNESEEVGDGDVVRVNTSLVTVPVSVMDRSGRYIPSLRQQDFRIFEDGVEQQIAYFASVEKPFTVALVLDMSESTRFKMEEIQDAAIAFVDQLRPEDRVLVVAFSDQVSVLAEATNDRYLLREAIRRTHNGGSTRLYDAVDFVINQRLNRLDGRKAVVLFTDGVDTTSRQANYQSNVRDAEQADALIYPVQYDTYGDMNNGGGGPSWPPPGRRRSPNSNGGIWVDILGDILGGPNNRGGRGGGGGGGAGTSRGDYDRADAYLQEMAGRTGGRLYRADSLRDLTQSFAYIAEELRRQYSLGYYPKTTARAAGERRQISVRVSRPDLVVRARDSYIYNSPNGGPATAQTNSPRQQPPPQQQPQQRPQQQTLPPDLGRWPFNPMQPRRAGRR